MPNISLNSAQYNAPGVYLSEDTRGNTLTSVISFSSGYIFGEVPELVSTSLTTGIPYLTPILLGSLTEYEQRLGNGNINNFIAPTSGPTLTTYNSVKQFFRNAPSAGASLYIIRVKPVDSFVLQMGTPTAFDVTDTSGLSSVVYGYPVTINDVPLGRVDYDQDGTETHIGIVVPQSITPAQAVLQLIDAIRDSSLSSELVLQDGDDNVSVRIYPRLSTGKLYVNGYDTSLLSAGAVAGLNYPSFSIYKYDPTYGTVSAANKTKSSDYVYAIETAIDPGVFPPGFLMAPAAFSKFNPEDRLIVGTALENKASEIDFSWMAIVDCGPQDGTDIANNYGYPVFSLDDQTNLPTNEEEPFYIAETQEFYQRSEGIPTYGSEGSINYIDGIEITLDGRFATPQAVITPGNTIDAGVILNLGVNGHFVVNRSFAPTVANIDPLDPVGDGTMLSGYLSPYRMVKRVVKTTDLTVAVVGTALNAGQYISAGQVLGNPVTSTGYYRVQASFTPTVLPIDPANPDGGSVSLADPGVLYGPNHYVGKGQLLDHSGILYYANRPVLLNNVGQIPSTAFTDGSLDRDIPLAYYKEWVRVNLSEDVIKLATYTPNNVNSVRIGARSVLYNNASHEAFKREHLMYSTAAGHLAYYAPYVIDLEGYAVPPSSSVVATGLRIYADRGFFEPIGGVGYPLRGVLRPQIEITRAHQQSSNPTGLNAIRLLPNQGTVIWGARTRSANKLFRWINTRIIVNVVINSLRNSFDDKIFRAIDGTETMFREIRGTAEGLLYRLYSGGALFGANPSDAYRVIVNSSNNSNFSIEDGIVNVQIFVVPVSTLEVISISITRSAIGTLDVAVGTAGN